MSITWAARIAIGFALIAMVVAGCAGAATGTPPAPSSGPSVTTPDEAVAPVVATEPRLSGIQAFDTGLIGQSSWYTVESASATGAYEVTVHVGWGDCPAGCIDEHRWVFAVSPDGAVSVVSEAGPPVPPDAWPSPLGAGRTGIAGLALAGPVCPVETVPPDPDCAPRPVVGATIIIRDASGSEVGQVVSGDDGSFFAELLAGDYTLEPQPVEGLLGTAGSIMVSVIEGNAALVQLAYDTGIR